MAWRLTINGVDQTSIVDAVSIATQLNDRTRATLVLADLLAPRHQEVISYRKDGVTPMFGGVIVQRAFAGRSPVDPDYQLTLECGDFFAFADWTFSNAVFPTAVTLKSVLQTLVSDNLAQYGITLDAAQDDGPTLEPFSWQVKRVSDAIRELSDRTGYVARISATKVLRMLLPGTEPAPFAITEAAPYVHELSWHDSDHTVANKVTVLCGPTGVQQVADERHYGDGVTRVWELNAPFVQVVGALSRSDSEGGWPLGTYGVDDFPYTYEAATNSVHQRADQPVVPTGEYIWLWYMAQFPFTVTATTGATPVIEHVEVRPDVLSRPVGQEIANGLLSQRSATPREVSLTTDVDGLEVGQALTIDLPVTRAIAGTFVVTSVALTIVLDTTEGDAFWQYHVEALESDIYQGSYLDQWRKMTGNGSSGSAGAVSGGGGGTLPPAGGGTAGPSTFFLGGSRTTALFAAPVAWLPVVDYLDYIAPSSFSALVRVDLFARHASVGAQARLFNITDGVPVAPASSVVTSTTAVPTTFVAAVESGKRYRLEVISTVADESVFAIGTVEAA